MQEGEGEGEGPPPPPPMQQDTYIVQFPREQVYYVPPPENAVFLQRQRESPESSSHHRCCPLSFIFGLILLSVVAILGVAITTLCFLYKPIQPSFSVSTFMVHVKNSSRSLLYEISFTANNPNARTGLRYDGDSSVSLILNNTTVATGKFPGLEQDPEASTKVKVELMGQGESTVNGKNETERAMSYDLEMRIGVKNKAVGLTFWSMECNVVCKFKVSKLGNDTRILSQQCNTNS